MSVPEAKKWWKQLVELFQTSEETKLNGFKTGLACALLGAADDDVMGDVIKLVQDPRHGQHQIVLLSILSRSARPDAWEASKRAAEEPDLAKEAKVQLRHLARRKRKRVFS